MSLTSAEIVNLQHICRTFQEGKNYRKVLDNLSFQANTGELVAITGPSGSGKSTLLNILGGIDIPDSGKVIIHDENIVSLDEHKRTLFRRHTLGFVFQFFNLVPTLTVAENIALPLMLCGSDDIESTTGQWLHRVGLADRATSFPDVLSGGEQQRIAIVRAAINQPKLILADEPTGNLDNKAGEIALQLIEDIVLSGTCVIMVTHNELAATRAHRRLVLENGQLRAN